MSSSTGHRPDDQRDLFRLARWLSCDPAELDAALLKEPLRLHFDCECDCVTSNMRWGMLLVLRWLSGRVFRAPDTAEAVREQAGKLWALSWLMIESGVFEHWTTYAEQMEACDFYARNWLLLGELARCLLDVTAPDEAGGTDRSTPVAVRIACSLTVRGPSDRVHGHAR